MKLKVKFLKWSAGAPVAMLHSKTSSKLGVKTKGRISLTTISKHPKEISTIVDIIQDGLVTQKEIAVSSEIKKRLSLKKGQTIDVNLTEPPRSINFIKKKLNNHSLSKKEVYEIISDIVSNELSEAEIALFVSAIYKQGMNFKETIYLIEAILESGNIFKLKNKFVVDKHCIGGIPGNRTTPIVVSICAAAGLTFPKSSSKAITSAAGTADVIEVLAKIEFNPAQLKKILSKTGAFLVWGGSLDMVPADSKIIQIEKSLHMDPEAQLLASIMSKKLAVDSDYILIDIPYGKTAKVNKKKAEELKKKFEKLGKHFGKKLKVILTKGEQPIGNGIGPILELIDILKILNPNQLGPKDLEEKSLFLAGQLLEMTKKAKKGKGIELAEKILNSGKALKKFKEIIKAQGGKIKKLKPGKFQHNLVSKKAGKIYEIDNKKINLLARVAGCPADKSSGIYLYVHKDTKVKRNEKLLTIYAESKSRLNNAIKFYKQNYPLKIK